MKLMNKAKKSESGFSLVELLAVVGIGGALVAGALLLVGDVQSKREIKAHSENISTIFNNMQNLFSDEPVDGDEDVLITAGVFPSSLNIDESARTIKTMGGGLVEIEDKNNDGFQLTYNKIKTSTCVEVIKAQRSVGWDKWSVKGGNQNADATNGTAFDGTTVSSIAGVCGTEGSGDWVSLAFYIE